MIDIKAIRAEAAEGERRGLHGGLNPATVIALCDEIEKLRHTDGMPLAMLGIDQLIDENKELRQEVQRLRKDAAMEPTNG